LRRQTGYGRQAGHRPTLQFIKTGTTSIRIIKCSPIIKGDAEAEFNMGDTYACTARAVTWELRRQISIVTGTVEAKFNMGDTYACTARATTWELRRQISTR
jgi:hypothetical protein